mgnify:CR=1 FL=1
MWDKLFPPKWRHRNPAIRAEAVNLLRADDPNLAEVITRDADAGIRRLAARRLEDLDLLFEVMGQAYTPADDEREAFILLDSDERRSSGNSSCNNFCGGYVIEAGQRIRFAGNMGATMMACPDMSTEQAFMEALRRADNYSVSGDELSLNKARMAPLLRFRLAANTD